MLFIKARVGKREITVSQLGFGCARLFGGIEKRHASRLLEHAYELGIRHFDTAPSYGHGQSENILGDVFAGVDDITIMTKIGIPRPAGTPSFASVARRLTLRRALSYTPKFKRLLLAPGRSKTSSPVSQTNRVLERDAVWRALDDSLKRLRRDCLDFYCVHEPDQYVIDDDLLALFDDLKANGKISAHGLAWGRAAPTAPTGWDVIQTQYLCPCPRDGRLRFFHGLLRSDDGPKQLAMAMRKEGNAVFLISASERHQLTDLTKRIASQ